MRTYLLIAASLSLTACMAANGIDDRLPGRSACSQLKECLCDPKKTTNVPACNTGIDDIARLPNGQANCRARLVGSCGRAIVVESNRVDVGGQNGSTPVGLTSNCVKLRDQCCPIIFPTSQQQNCLDYANIASDAQCKSYAGSLCGI